MADRLYNADEIDPLVDDLAKQAHTALRAVQEKDDALKQAASQVASLEARIRELEARPLVLEKVAAQEVRSRAERIAKLMVDRQIIDDNYQTKMAANMAESPTQALDTLERVILSCVPSVQNDQGGFVQKPTTPTPQASSIPDGWF